MEERIYNKMFTRQINCLWCDSKITERKTIKVVLHSENQTTLVEELNMPYCPKCDFSYADGEDVKLRKLVSDDPTLKLKTIREDLSLSEAKTKCILDYDPQREILKTLRYSINSEIVNIKYCERYEKRCPNCARKTKFAGVLLPFESGCGTIVYGKACPECNEICTTEKDIWQLLKDNDAAKTLTYNGIAGWNYTLNEKQENKKRRAAQRRAENEHYQNLLREKESGEIVLKTVCNDFLRDFTIVTNRDDADGEKYLYFRTEFARDLLTAAFCVEKEDTVVAGNLQIQIVDTYFKNDKYSEHLVPTDSIKIRRVNLNDRKYETIAIMLYSPFTGKLEVTYGFFDEDNEFCIATNVFRRFIKKYGRPNNVFYFPIENYSGGAFSLNELRAESALREYGYTVGQNQNLSETERHEMLSELIDLELLPSEYILKLLEFNIQLHSTEKDAFARMKWKKDADFVFNYEKNTNRFILAV